MGVTSFHWNRRRSSGPPVSPGRVPPGRSFTPRTKVHCSSSTLADGSVAGGWTSRTYPEVNRRAPQHLDSPKARNVGIDAADPASTGATRIVPDGGSWTGVGDSSRRWLRSRRGRGRRPAAGGRRLGSRIARRRRINLRAVGSIPGRRRHGPDPRSRNRRPAPLASELPSVQRRSRASAWARHPW